MSLHDVRGQNTEQIQINRGAVDTCLQLMDIQYKQSKGAAACPYVQQQKQATSSFYNRYITLACNQHGQS